MLLTKSGLCMALPLALASVSLISTDTFVVNPISPAPVAQQIAFEGSSQATKGASYLNPTHFRRMTALGPNSSRRLRQRRRRRRRQ
jgi:hypothetical protein